MDILFFDRRPLFPVGFTAIFGIYAATGDNPVWALVFCALLLTGGLLAGTSRKIIIAAFISGLLFFGWGLLNEHSMDSAYKSLDNEKVRIRGIVASVDRVNDDYTAVTLRPDGFGKPRVRLYIMECNVEVLEGMRIEASGRLHKPRSRTNPGGYDKRKAFYSDRTTAYLYSQAENTSISRGGGFKSIIGLIRKDIREVCRELLGDRRGAVLAGMMTGDRTGLLEEDSEVFRDSGLSHTMAVSGSHVAYILVPVMFLCRNAGIERRKYYPWLLVLLLAFAVLTGFTPSVCRASLTAGLMIAAGLVSREPDSLNSLAASALILVFINPFAIYDAGFILSYSSVLSILIFYKPIIRITGKNPVMQVLALTLAVQPGVVAATMKIFYTVQLFSVVSNILVFPVRALAAVLGWIMYFLFGLFMPAARLVAAAEGVLADSITEVAGLFGDSVWSTINVPYVPAWLAAVIPLSVFLALKMKSFRFAYLAGGAALLCSYLLVFAIPCNTYVFYDVGQADSILIKTDRGKDILVDTGRHSPGSSLAHYTGDYIDCIFLTHAHEDHIGGLADILERFRVGEVYIPGCPGSQMEGVIQTCREHGVSVTRLLKGVRIKIDGYDIYVMNPADRDYLSLNDTSMVLKLTHGDTAILLTGDIESAAETGLLAGGRDLTADIFKVPHHGASGSAHKAFYDAVSPELAVICCGRNYFGHPSAKALELLGECGVFRTDNDGAVIIKARKGGYRVTAYGR